MTIMKHGRRYWRVYDDDGSLVCTAVYRKAAREVVRRLSAARGLNPQAAQAAAEASEKAAAVTVRKGVR